MNFKYIMASVLMAGTLAACSTGGENEGELIDKPDFKSETGIFDIDALEALGRVSAVSVSPDTRKVLFGISYESVEQNKSNNDLYVMDSDGSNLERITRTAGSEGNAVWINQGKQIAFTYAVDGVPQLWVMNADGSGRKQVTEIEKGVEGFLFSPDEKSVMIISAIKFSREAKDIYPDRRPHVQALGSVGH